MLDTHWVFGSDDATTRKPWLSLRLLALFLLRYDTRSLFGLLSNEPPRTTRLRPRPPEKAIASGRRGKGLGALASLRPFDRCSRAQ